MEKRWAKRIELKGDLCLKKCSLFADDLFGPSWYAVTKQQITIINQILLESLNTATFFLLNPHPSWDSDLLQCDSFSLQPSKEKATCSISIHRIPCIYLFIHFHVWPSCYKRNINYVLDGPKSVVESTLFRMHKLGKTSNHQWAVAGIWHYEMILYLIICICYENRGH